MGYSSNTRQSNFELLMSQYKIYSKMRVFFILKFGEFDFLEKIVLSSLLFIICTLLKI